MNKFDPVISVIVPTYQHARYIGECLNSILAQDLDQPWELIIGEDGSTDGTREICVGIANENPNRVRLILNEAESRIYIDGKRAAALV